MKQNKSNGFTLIEMLLVLSLLSAVLLLILPIHHSLVTEKEEQHFLEVLQSDVLLLQNLAMTTNHHVSIRFSPGQYSIVQSNQFLKSRTFPKHWTIQMNTLKQISFTSTGSIREAGSITIKADQTAYDFICPPGKGGCYVKTK